MQTKEEIDLWHYKYVIIIYRFVRIISLMH